MRGWLLLLCLFGLALAIPALHEVYEGYHGLVLRDTLVDLDKAKIVEIILGLIRREGVFDVTFHQLNNITKNYILFRESNGRPLVRSVSQNGQVKTIYVIFGHFYQAELQIESTINGIHANRVHWVGLWCDFDGVCFVIQHRQSAPLVTAASWSVCPKYWLQKHFPFVRLPALHLLPSSEFHQSRQQPKEFKLMTFNIWNFNEPWKSRLYAMKQTIDTYEPMVIAFQEVRYDADAIRLDLLETVRYRPFLEQLDKIPDDQVDAATSFEAQTIRWRFQSQSLKEILPHYPQYIFQPAMTYLEQTHSIEGLAFFSQYPILESSSLLLTRNLRDEEDSHQRICLRILVDVPGIGPTHIFNTHSTLSEEAQTRNVLEMWHWMNRFGGRQILVGDLNARPDSNVIRFLTGDLELEGVTGDFVDAWSELYTGQDGFTFLSWQPDRRIDFVLYRGAKLQASRVEIDCKPKTVEMFVPEIVFASDHCVLTAHFINPDRLA